MSAGLKTARPMFEDEGYQIEFGTELRHLGKKNPKYDVSFKIMPKVVRMGNWSQLPVL